jgi:hypothetical protein
VSLVCLSLSRVRMCVGRMGRRRLPDGISCPHLLYPPSIHPSILLVDQQRRFDLFPFLVSRLWSGSWTWSTFSISGASRSVPRFPKYGGFNGWIDGVVSSTAITSAWAFLGLSSTRCCEASAGHPASSDAYIDGRTNNLYLVRCCVTPKIS